VATSTIKGKTPFEAFWDEIEPGVNHTPDIAHLRVLGCKTFVLIQKERRVQSQKLASRAEVGIWEVGGAWVMEKARRFGGVQDILGAWGERKNARIERNEGKDATYSAPSVNISRVIYSPMKHSLLHVVFIMFTSP
jgi:hypothetical protein